jgi:integrase
MAGRKTPLIRGYREVDMGETTLEELARRHQEALEADQKSPKTRQHYAWGAKQAITYLAALLGREPTLADWRDPELQRRRYRTLAERERSGQWRRATTCCQFRADSGWESFLVREGLVEAGTRIMGRVIRRPKGTTPQKAPVSLALLRRIPALYNQDRYEELAELVRILTLVDTLVRAEELCAIRLDEYDRRTGVLRITHPKGGGSRAVQLSRHTQRLVTRYLDLRAARLTQRGEELRGADRLFATIHERPLSYWGLKETLRRLSRRLGHPVHAHLLRHTGAVRLLVNGMPQITLQQVLGHTTLEMTRRYVKLSEEETLTAHRSYAVMDNLTPRGGRDG